ncbi:hypothetical protein P171DRAFT_359446 [Karstenula rhodostoma CBS 690.94]|uniref:Uncharacterized protein n=1 Tax=Karstenula rhodostoma CBS 690.94 TaxID=1392251 RepID=A0A9P4UC40_9PLEO|nr:hypothetical protein P171DRAFT_359446 [Karstenula rhodostoma CBS 690.94]
MLSYPDRHRFEEIRSRWEAAQVANSDIQLRMVGRKEKTATQPLNGDESTNTSKFRRKLSQGLSIISLSQRKTTPVRPLLPSNDLSGSVDVPHPHPHESARLMSPIRDPSSYGISGRKVTPEKPMSSQMGWDAEAMPKQLPRSRTMSFIPRPNRNESASPVVETDPGRMSSLPCTLEEETCVTPTKVPSPDSSSPVHRNSSPRQYNSSLTTQQAKHVAAGNSFDGVKDQSPSKTSPVRSHTTPNLVNTAHSHGPISFTSPRRPNQHRLSGISGPQRSALKENSTPVTQRHVKRLSNIQEHSPQSPRREGLLAPNITSKRRSTGPASMSVSSRQRACATPSASSKRKNSQSVAQTPFAAQRAVPKKRSPVHPVDSRLDSNEDTYTKMRLLGPVSPSTSTKTAHAATRSSLPRATTEKDLRKRTFPAPKKRTGGVVLTRSQAMVNNEVRFSRSSTLHDFAGVEDVPPVPPIPEKYKSASMSMLVSAEKPFEKPTSYAEGTIQEQKSRDTNSHSSDSLVTALPMMLQFGDVQQNSGFDEACSNLKPHLTKKKSKLSIRIPTPGRSFSASLMFSAKAPQDLDIANIGVSPQVKDYMPALYWAGRFQSRYDQWRTEAMQVELDPEYHMKGPLAHCNVHQENLAACHIFLQLRELCLSHQAADSLWEFEHKYRQDHNLLGTSCDLPPLNPKPDDGKQGSLGRAIRKMTPRKSSFVNLLKGKGWNAEDLKSTDGSSDRDLTVSKTFETSEGSHLV